MELTKRNLTIILTLLAVIVGLALHLVLFNPLIVRIKAEHLKCKELEAEILEAGNAIEAMEKKGGRISLSSEEETSIAIGELTQQGIETKVNIVSMAPRRIEKDKEHNCKVLPIELELESSYEAFGEFLGLLDDLEKGLVKVQSFKVRSDEKDPSMLKTSLVVNMCFSGD